MDIYTLIKDFGSLFGIVLTACLSYVIYRKSIALKNFFLVCEKFEKSSVMAAESMLYIQVKGKDFINKGTQKQLSKEDVFAVISYINVFIQMSILYRRRLINKKLCFLHYSYVLQNLYETRRDVIDFFEKDIQDKDITYLYGEFMHRRKICIYIWNKKESLKRIIKKITS